MLHAPPEAYLISWILLYHPGPLASLFDCLLRWPGLGGVLVWACRGLQSQGTSITEFSPLGPCGGWSGCLLARASFFRPWCLPCLLLHPVSSLLHPSVSLPTQSVKACTGHALFHHVPVRLSPLVSLSRFLLPSLQHVWCVAINKMAALSGMWQAILLHIWDFRSRMVIKSAVSLGRRVFLTSLLNVAQQLCSHWGKSLSPSSFFLHLQKENG